MATAPAPAPRQIRKRGWPRPAALGLFLTSAGATAAAISFLMARQFAIDAAVQTWPPFVLVTGLLLIGVVANEDGVFIAAAALLGRAASGRTTLFLAGMLLVAAVTALLNLDTSAAFLTPVLIHVARARRAGEERFLYGCVFMSNAASLLLPGSNLTNLLILASQPLNGAVFLRQMVLPWIGAVVLTIVVVALAFRSNEGQAPSVRSFPRPLRPLSVAAVVIVVILTLSMRNPAVPVLTTGAFLVAARLIQGQIALRRVTEGFDARHVLGIYMLAVALGTVARGWSFPATLMQHAGPVATAAIGAVASVFVNNLPAAVLLGSRMPAHPQSLLFGLNIGPNLAVTGSLSALIWWQAARSVGAQPSARRYSAVGIILVPITITAALLSAWVSG